MSHQFLRKKLYKVIFTATEKGKYLQSRLIFIHYLARILIKNYKT